MRFLPVNLDAVLVELDDLDQTLALLASLEAEPIAGVRELVPAARTLLVHFRPSAVTLARLLGEIGRRPLARLPERLGELIEIPVTYDGEDLDEVADILGLTRDEVIRRHTGSDYTVAFTGFAPGFAYLSGGHPSLDVPRRRTPRTRIPAGAVALAGRFSGVYPKASPGGWQIIGVTTTPMWDLGRAVPALLQPGARVRFVDLSQHRGRPQAAARADDRPAPAEAAPGPGAGTPAGPALQVIRPGLLAAFQDLGRHGQASQGVSASGAMDRGALRAANRLVGNPAGTACIEITCGGFECTSRGDTVVAVAGAPVPMQLTTAAGEIWPLPTHHALALADGDRLTLGEPREGVRSYLALRGGFEVAPVLGSCATDTLAQIGPPALRAGDLLAARPVACGAAIVGEPEAAAEPLPAPGQMVVLDVVLGPRTDWFTEEAVAGLAEQVWTVTPQSNRVGLRLAGDTPLARRQAAELPSEGTTWGAIQVPPSGQPVLFLADHPLTGGYPVIGAVAPHHLDRAGQIPVGAQIRFHPIRAFQATHPSDWPETP
jgi:KipI family sensor histidine kinase inhibitor